MNEQDEDSKYADAYKKRDEALRAYGAAHQEAVRAACQADTCMDDLREAELELARAIGLLSERKLP